MLANVQHTLTPLSYAHSKYWWSVITLSPILDCKSQNASTRLLLQPCNQLIGAYVWDGSHFLILDLHKAIKLSWSYLLQSRTNLKESDQSASQTSSLSLSSLGWTNIESMYDSMWPNVQVDLDSPGSRPIFNLMFNSTPYQFQKCPGFD